ncbi:MAG: peptidylprolyl isomerase [Ilumatobacteraceae bacterium]
MGTAKRERQKAGRQSRREEAVATARKKRSRQQLRTYAIMAGLIIAVALFFVLRGGGDDNPTVAATGASGASGTTTTVPFVTTYGTTACPPTDGSGERKITFADSFKQCIDPAKTYTATITTNKGVLVVDLDAKAAPITVNNFVSLARSKFYDAVPCHRIIPNFVAQCGDPQGTGSGGPGYDFGDELPAAGTYKVGSLAMANSGANTNGSQFFIITGSDGAALPPNYSFFGQAKPGQEATIAALDAAGSTVNNGVPPKEAVGLTSVTITES